MSQELPENFHEPAFTPGRQHFAALFALLAEPDEARAEQAEKALARAGLPAALRAGELLQSAQRPVRARLTRLLGRVASKSGGEPLRSMLLALVSDDDPKTRRNAIIALGKVGGEGVEAALLGAWHAASLPERRSITEALGKTGGAAAREHLASTSADDPELERLRKRAILMLDRTLSRETCAPIELDRPLGRDALAVVRCRDGLAELLWREMLESGLSPEQPRYGDEVELSHRGPLAPLSELRIALDYGFAFPILAGENEDAALLDALDGPDARRLLLALSAAPVRFRLHFAQGGHRRARVWRIAEALTRRESPLRNDPTEAPWEARVDDRAGRVVWIPRAAPDRRFAYRKRDVPAASHPSIAAALARAAGVRADDVVWDPFVGSGLELCERALLGPYDQLIGSDIDERALDAARENLSSAHVERFRLELADVRSATPSGVTLLITNPPMGRRIARDGSLGRLTDAAVEAAGRSLAADGRLVWLSPQPQRSAQRLAHAGFRLRLRQSVDLGGFSAELQVAERRR